ncbi:MAG: CZB domain-containing protein [Calditrichaeota bacterium]|nr:CZB domain-containing protein [Calditrichota bacterium]
MSFTNIKIKYKIYGLVILSFAFLILITTAGLFGLSKIETKKEDIFRHEQVEKLFLHKEIDHLKWIAAVKNAIIDGSSRINVEKDPHKCALGQWLYGSQRKLIEEEIPTLIQKFISIERPHAALHQSAVSLEEKLQQNASQQELINFYSTDIITHYEDVISQLNDISGELDHETEMSQNEMNDMLSFLNSSSVYFLVISLVVLMVLGSILSKSILQGLKESVEFTQEIEKGNLFVSISTDREDEIGELLTSLNNMSANLRKIIGNIHQYSGELSKAAGSMNSISQKLSTGSGDMAERTSSVSSAAEQMSATMRDVSSASEQANSNLTIVSSSTEEMTATVSEIAKNAENARHITQNAVNSVKQASGKVNVLGNAANEISKVIEVINEISEQTKLLALNATIEAARAGEAGKGFTVVANEVKELAKQTNNAIDEIRSRIDAIQGSTSETVSEINNISQIIGDVNEIVSNIATAVEEQNVTTRDISENIGQAAMGISAMNNSLAQSAEASKMIAQDITSVNTTTNEVRNDSQTVNQSAQQLSQMSENLKGIVDQFKLN